MSLEQLQLQSPIMGESNARLLQSDVVLGISHRQTLHAWQQTISSPLGYLQQFVKHTQRRQLQSLYRLGRARIKPQKSLASGGWLENLSDLRHESLVWRPCWISGGYRLEAASRPIALYIVGIREAQGRNQHFNVWYRNMVERILVGDGGLSWQIRTG